VEILNFTGDRNDDRLRPDIGYPAEIFRGFHHLFQASSGNTSNWATTPSFPGHSSSSHIPTLYIDSSRFRQQLCSGKFSASWPWRKLEFYIRIVNWMCKHKGVQLKPKFQHTGTRSAAAYPPRACVVAQQYSPTTLISLRSHSRKEKFDESQKCYFILFIFFLTAYVWTCVGWECLWSDELNASFRGHE
jgi:hypothetical protein